MKFFKKPAVAVILTVLLVALCCVWGYSRANPSGNTTISAAQQNHRAGESNLNYFLNWIDDGAGIFSMETTDTLARNNLELSSTYGCLLALKTVNYLNGQDIEPYSKALFEELELEEWDMLLVIETSRESWYLVYGGGLREYMDGNQALTSLLRTNLGTPFFQGDSDENILKLSDDLADWCAENLPVVDNTESLGPLLPSSSGELFSLWDILVGIFFTLLVNIWWIVLLFVVLNLVDRYRFQQYVTRYPPGSDPPLGVFFHPVLFWHRSGSSWYKRMLERMEEAGEDEDASFGGSGGQNGGWQQENQQDTDGQRGPYVGPDAGPYVGPDSGPYVGPDGGQPGGYGFWGGPEERHGRGLWGSMWRMGNSSLRGLQYLIDRFFGGRRF